MSCKAPKIGLALSGGTLKAAAHVGVLSSLEDLGIHPDAIAGTSAGSFVAALYAHGYTTGELCHLIDHFPGPKLFDYGYPVATSVMTLLLSKLRPYTSQYPLSLPNGLLRGHRLRRYFQTTIGRRSAMMPLYIIATDILTGQPVTFTNDNDLVRRGMAERFDDVSLAVAGSCSLPGVLTPVSMGDHLLVDGACRHYVPVEVLRSIGCDHIIAVNLYDLDKSWRPNTFIDVLSRSFEILLQESIDNDVTGDDLYVLKPQIQGVNYLSFGELRSLVDIGKRVVQEHQDGLTAFISGHARRHDRPRSNNPPMRAPLVRIQGSKSELK